MAGEEGIRWLRPATQVETAFEMLGGQEIMLVIYKLGLSSSVPLTHQQVTQALTHLFRKAPNLRVCMEDKDGAKWFREMSSENIDFQVMGETISVEEVAQELNTYKYNHSEGPLWCARLVPVTQPSYTPARFSSFCHDLQHDFPHCYYMMFGFNHCMGDGHSYRKITGLFVSLLDDILSRTSINDEEQLGNFVLNEEFETTVSTHEAEIENDPALKQKYIDVARKGQPEKPLLDQILPPTGGPDRKTLLISQSFDCETTSKFIKQCKAHKMSVNSGFSAAAILAFAKLLDEEGIKQDKYAISSCHLVNVRRFWDPLLVKDNLGCYIGMLGRHFTQTPRTVTKEEFWEFARGVHDDFYNALKSDDVMYRLAFVGICHKKYEPYNDRDLTFNTLGDVSSMFTGRKHLQVTHFVNTSSIHKTPIVWDHITCTIRGRLIHSIKYNSGLLTKDIVTRYMDHIYRWIQEVID